MSAKSSPEIRYVDTHCHLDGDDFAEDLPQVLERASADGVTRWINVGYAPERWLDSIRLSTRFDGMSFVLGVHPGHAAEWSPDVERDLRNLIEMYRPVAVGEIGLDFYRGETNVDQQIEAFVRQLALAREFDLPVAIHMRDAEELVLQTLDAQPALPRLLFHSFDGSSALTEWINDRDAYIGVGGLATRRKSDQLRRHIATIGLDRIVLETDSPYLVPNGFKHRRNTPESIPLIARSVADQFETDVEEVASRTTANANHLFWSQSHT